MRGVTEMSLREVLRRMMGYNIVCVLVLLVTSAAFPGTSTHPMSFAGVAGELCM